MLALVTLRNDPEHKGLLCFEEPENGVHAARLRNMTQVLKDLATDLPEGLKLGAVLKRGEYRDALVHKSGKKLHELDENDVIGTSSLRRVAGLKKINPKVQIVDIRGNVNTRLQKMEKAMFGSFS